jgi:hypothetical protein
MIRVTGMGWWLKGSWGRVLSGRKGAGEGQGMFRRQFNNLGRLDSDSKAAAYAVALALEDAGLDYPLAPGTTAGIAGSSALGCLNADLTYFRDYVDCGRTLGRGNYFIYTLPTSPLAECSIHFGLEGPVLYLGGGSPVFALPLEAAANAMEDAQAELMLAGANSSEGAMFVVLGPEGEAGLGLDEVRDALKKVKDGQAVTEAVGLIENLMKERGIKAAA